MSQKWKRRDRRRKETDGEQKSSLCFQFKRRDERKSNPVVNICGRHTDISAPGCSLTFSQIA